MVLPTMIKISSTAYFKGHAKVLVNHLRLIITLILLPSLLLESESLIEGIYSTLETRHESLSIVFN